MCPSGKDNLCDIGLTNNMENFHLVMITKYVYSHFGYNLKATDLQAAIGCAQLKNYHLLWKKRRHNFERLKDQLCDLTDQFILPEPCPDSRPSWFGFLITCKNGIDKNHIVQYLESHGVQTRMLFSGNLIKQPCFDEMRKMQTGYRKCSSLETTDLIMERTFWIGCIQV